MVQECPACHAGGLVMRFIAMDRYVCCPTCAYWGRSEDPGADVAFV